MELRKLNKKNKKGWIKIIEAFIAIGLFTGILFLIIQSEPFRTYERDFFETRQTEILNSIQNNDTLRNDVFSVTDFGLTSEDSAFPESLTNFLSENLYSNFECYLKVCSLDGECDFGDTSGEEVYTKDVIITSTLSNYSPRQLKLFCIK